MAWSMWWTIKISSYFFQHKWRVIRMTSYLCQYEWCPDMHYHHQQGGCTQDYNHSTKSDFHDVNTCTICQFGISFLLIDNLLFWLSMIRVEFGLQLVQKYSNLKEYDTIPPPCACIWICWEGGGIHFWWPLRLTQLKSAHSYNVC